MLALHTNTSTTMTSREIAELTGKNHADVLRDIRGMMETLEKDVSTFAAIFLDAYKREQPMFRLPYDETICLLTGYDVKARMAVIKRWQELEAQQTSKPKTRLELARENVALLEEIEEKDGLLALQAPAVAFVQKFVEAKSSKCLSDVAKILGKKPLAFINQLSDDHVIFKRNGSWIPYQTQLDAGRFTVKTGESSGHAYEQTRVEPKGIEWLAKIYG